jgi:prepilin-type processing-associated H-X9-DG protein
MNSYCTWGVNSNPHVPGTTGNNLRWPENAAWKITQVRHSADKIIVYEEDERALRDGRGQMQSPSVSSNANNIIGMLAIRHDSKRVQPDDVPAPGTGRIEDQVNRQRKGNVAFVDGHADYVERVYAHDRTHYDPKM